MLFAGVTVQKDARVVDSILMPGAFVAAGAQVYKSIIGENSSIGENAVIGGRL